MDNKELIKRMQKAIECVDSLRDIAGDAALIPPPYVRKAILQELDYEREAFVQAIHSLQSQEASKACPPADWDTYALEKAREIWSHPAGMPKSQRIAKIQCALLDAMRWARPHPTSQEAEPVASNGMGYKEETENKRSGT